MSAANPGDRCSNGPHVECWTCPNCYHDHTAMVSQCEDCGIKLSCSIERPPIAVCTVVERDA